MTDQAPQPTPQETPNPRRFWPQGAIPAGSVKRYGALAFALIIGLIYIVSSHTGLPGEQQPTVNRFDPSKSAPPTPTQIGDITKSLHDEQEKAEADQERIAKEKKDLEQAKQEYGDRIHNLNQENDGVRNERQIQPVGDQPAIQAGSGNGSSSNISTIVQDLRQHPKLEAQPVPQQTQSAQPQPVSYPVEYTQPRPQIAPTEQLNTEPEAAPQQPKRKDLLHANPAWPTVILPQGMVIETVLVNKLEGSNAGQVKCMVTTPVYQTGTHNLVFPAGTEVLGETASVTAFGQNRLGLVFHRALVHRTDSTMYPVLFDDTAGMDQEGATGLHDKVNNHWLSTFAVAGVVGGIAGLSEIGNSTSGFGIDPMAQFRTGVTQQMSQESMQIMSKFLNRAPSITIRPGTRVKLMLVSDLSVPLFKEAL